MSSKQILLFVLLIGIGVTPARGEATPIELAANQIDRLLEASWSDQGITPVAESDDAEFCRRVWLDLTGVAPPVFELRKFLRDESDDKRSRLVDRLLRSPGHSSHMASIWTDILLPNDVQAQFQSRENVGSLHQWLQTQFRENQRYDALVAGFLKAGGRGNSGPAVFYTSHSIEPEKLASATSRIFMGIQLQCAQCHDHPFDRWSQEDFWRYAAFFSQLRTTDGPMGATNIEDRPGGEVTLPDSEEVMEPRYPGISEPPEPDPTNHRRTQLTIWLASRDNPYFARAAVNRVWGQMFGRGLVDPVDAMDASNRPSHPALLSFLSDYFVERRFSLRDLYATIARTKAYGRTSAVAGDSRPPADSFAAMTVKTLSAEQFYDSLQQNIFRKGAVLPSNLQSVDRATRDQFLSRMRAPGVSARDYPHGVVQALGLMNGPEVGRATSDDQSALLNAIEAPFFDEDQQLETLFLATLSRPPREHESQQFLAHLASASTDASRRAALSDVLWILLNTAECAVCP